MPGEGAVMLGQELNPDLANHIQDLAGPIFRVTRNGDKLERGATVDLPGTVTLFGFQSFTYEGRPLLARLNINDKLQVLEASGATLWESSDFFGGSESSFERPDGMQGGGTRYAFLHPRLEAGPEGTVLVPVNEGAAPSVRSVLSTAATSKQWPSMATRWWSAGAPSHKVVTWATSAWPTPTTMVCRRSSCWLDSPTAACSRAVTAIVHC